MRRGVRRGMRRLWGSTPGFPTGSIARNSSKPILPNPSQYVFRLLHAREMGWIHLRDLLSTRVVECGIRRYEPGANKRDVTYRYCLSQGMVPMLI